VDHIAASVPSIIGRFILLYLLPYIRFCFFWMGGGQNKGGEEKMKKIMIIGSLLSVFILIILPTTSSLQFNKALINCKFDFFEKINIDIKELIEKLEDKSSQIFSGNMISLLKVIITFVLTTVIIAILIYIYVSSMIGPPP